jgi:putative ABC transport system permease protein
MQRWLEGFAYHTSLNILAFFASGILALFIALLTVSFQTFKAATTNPVDSLRYE